MNATTVAVDLAKNVLQIAILRDHEAYGTARLNRKLERTAIPVPS
jgi:hypothetical protein